MGKEAGKATRRSYDQYCAVARGLDVIGERWTLLLIRELLLGPMRYKDLIAGLPGIGTNLLAARLHELEEIGIVERRVLPPPAGSTVYQLTEVGAALEPVVAAIGRWGARFLGSPRKTDWLLPNPYFVAMRAMFRPETAAGMRETYELRIAGQVYEVRLEDGCLTTGQGPATHPDVVVTMDVGTLNALLRQGLSPREAIATKRVTLEGDPRALERFVKIFALRRPEELGAKPSPVLAGRGVSRSPNRRGWNER